MTMTGIGYFGAVLVWVKIVKIKVPLVIQATTGITPDIDIQVKL